MTQTRLLELDGIGNILLGLPLLLFPVRISEALGISPGSSFYQVILGAIFVGIGVALLLERFRPSLGGLGLGGAVSINLLFGIVLAVWLIRTDATLPNRSLVVLSVLAVVLIGISLLEIRSIRKQEPLA